MPEQIKRHIAFKARIKDLLDGKYVKEDGDWAPNYIQTKDKQISRVNLLGVIVSKPIEGNSNYENMILDDGSGRISIRSFDNKMGYVGVGDVVSVIGRPREFGNEYYIVPEIIKKIEDKKWIEVRKLELKKDCEPTKQDIVKGEIIGNTKSGIVINDPAVKIFGLIKEFDKGSGADTQEVIDKCNMDDSEKIIKNLLETGEIFEIKPGKLKVLE